MCFGIRGMDRLTLKHGTLKLLLTIYFGLLTGVFLWCNVHFRDFHGRESSDAVFRRIFSGGSFTEPLKSFNNSADLSTQSKYIQRCNYRLFNLVQIIQLCTKDSTYHKQCANHSTQLKYIQHRNYESFNVVITNYSTQYKLFNVLKIVEYSCGIYKHQSTVENRYTGHY